MRDQWGLITHMYYISWNRSFENKYVFVYEDQSEILGFCELREDGYIDRFYTRADSIGQGVGTFLYMTLESKAKELRLSKLFVDASITAKPFFEKMNFSMIKEKNVSLSGVSFINYLMENQLSY